MTHDSLWFLILVKITVTVLGKERNDLWISPVGSLNLGAQGWNNVLTMQCTHGSVDAGHLLLEPD